MTFSKLHHFFAVENAPLAKLAEQAARFEQITKLVQNALPASLSGHCLGISIHEPVAVLLTDSAAWATQLRFHETGILGVLNKNSDHVVKRITVRVLSPGETKNAAATEPAYKTISASNRALLRASAKTVSDDQLSAALQRLANNPDAADKKN
ncbi:MAG: DciA family protein [Gammaproteobacteria bacterium]|nr:DciA family protein [Gammaproteobacteria bacterium]